MKNFQPKVDTSEQIKLIEELRDLKELRGMTNQEIVDKTIENGEPVSIASVKNVFSSNKNQNFDYKHTLLPIFNALVDNEDNQDPVIQVYQTRLEIKNETIKQLEDQVKSIKAEYAERLSRKDEKNKKREQFFMDQIEKQASEIQFKNEQIRHHNEAMDRKDALIKELYDRLLEKS